MKWSGEAIIRPLVVLITACRLTAQVGAAGMCYQCASTAAISDCASDPAPSIHKNCSIGRTGFRNYYCVTQTIEQKGQIVAVIRECTTDAGLGVTWCQLEESPMTGFAIKCTFVCSHDLCNSLPVRNSGLREGAVTGGSQSVATKAPPKWLQLIVAPFVNVLFLGVINTGIPLQQTWITCN